MSPIRIGVVGCGAIAQVHHLPNLKALKDLFEVAVICDLSPSLAEYAARQFHVPEHVTDYRRMLDADAVDAVLLCQSDPKTEVALAAFEAGRHVFIEKPMCYSLQEADAILAAAQKAGTVGQVGYMKVYDPAYERAKREVDGMDDIRFVQVNHLHPNNRLHLRQFDLKRFDDLPEDALERQQAARRTAVRDAIGDAPDPVSRAFFTLSGSMIHDLYGLRVMLGMPDRVVSTEIWQQGRGISIVLEYPIGARCVATWVDLPDLWDFRETLEVYGDAKRVLLSYPTGFARGIPSAVTVQEIDSGGTASVRQPAIDWESAFSRELRHFHACITDGAPNRTPVADARHDVALIIDIIGAYLAGGPVKFSASRGDQ